VYLFLKYLNLLRLYLLVNMLKGITGKPARFYIVLQVKKSFSENSEMLLKFLLNFN
jgi:hypothetical protein